MNLATLEAARVADRSREIAVRLSIGAGRLRIVRQLLTESVLLSLAGGAAGTALAVPVARLITGWRAPLDFPIQLDILPDARVFAFALGVALVAGLVAGIAPARQIWRAHPNDALKGAHGAGRAGRRWAFRDLLLAAQVALCSLLLTASFVSLRGLVGTFSAHIGMEPRHASAAGYDLALARYNKEDGRVFQKRALAAVAQLPGVTSAAFSSSIPLTLSESHTTLYSEHATDFRRSKGINVAYYEVSPGFFATLGTRMLAGRDFTWHDDARTPRVAIVNQTLARLVTGSADAATTATARTDRRSRLSAWSRTASTNRSPRLPCRRCSGRPCSPTVRRTC